MKHTNSSRRNGELLQEKISQIILLHMADPRLDMVTVSGVELSCDKSVANIYISAPTDHYDSVDACLASATPRIRFLLGKCLHWRVTPQLRFHIDKTIDNAQRIAEVLEDEHTWSTSISQRD